MTVNFNPESNALRFTNKHKNVILVKHKNKQERIKINEKDDDSTI
jgi:hypothetical protein